MIRRLSLGAGTVVRRLMWQGERFRWRIFHPITLGSRVILLRGNEVLLVRHTYRQGWYFPGGGVDKDETLEAAARREAEEEACARIGELTLLGVYGSVGDGRTDHIAVFHTRDFELRDFRPNNEIAAREWFALDSLPEGLGAADRRRLDELAGGGAPHGGAW